MIITRAVFIRNSVVSDTSRETRGVSLKGNLISTLTVRKNQQGLPLGRVVMTHLFIELAACTLETDDQLAS